VAKSIRIKAPEIPVPQTLAEAEDVLGRIGQLQRQVQVLEAQMNESLAEIKGAHEALAAPLVEGIEKDFMALQAWAEANRSTLLARDRKSTRVATGELGWRRTPPAVRITKLAAVVAALKKLGLGRYVRVKEEVDKEAIRREPEPVESIKGISITQQEEFWVKPFESQIERARSSKVHDGAVNQEHAL